MINNLRNNSSWRKVGHVASLAACMVMLPAATVAAYDNTTGDIDDPPPLAAAASQLGQPVPASVIVSANGLEWVWASPCAQNGCTSGIDVGHDGFEFATPAQWAQRPPNSAFLDPQKCAAPWFDHYWNHCDTINLVQGLLGSAPYGGLPAGVTGLQPMASYGETLLVRVANLPPTADANGPYLVAVGEEIYFDGSASSDPDGDLLSETWTADGGSVLGDLYTAGDIPGIYDVTLIVNDGTVDSDPDMSTVVVYDPTGGFVTGGGWISSEQDEGGVNILCITEDDCSGRANFGFVSKYKKGATVPTGETQFHFRDGELNFHSNVYNWLVVNQNGENAQYKGTGTVNGTGDYGFMLWAGDNGTFGDTFRIKIWNNGDGEAVVYDNGFDQEVGGGQIVIHKGKK